jgi:hypothetical protein
MIEVVQKAPEKSGLRLIQRLFEHALMGFPSKKADQSRLLYTQVEPLSTMKFSGTKLGDDAISQPWPLLRLPQLRLLL